MAPLLLLAPNVHAGTYMWQTTDANGHVAAQSPIYTVGQIHFRGGPGPDQDRPYNWSYQGCGISDGRGLATNISCSGANQATFTWQPDAGKTLATDPPPDQVIVKEATYARTIANGTVASPPTGGCSDGFGVSQNLILSGDGSGGGVTLSRTRYNTHPGGQTVALPSCEPTAHSANNSEESEVSYSATIYPITIDLTGTTPDSSGGDTILVGQYCKATLNGIPSTSEARVTYDWSVSGTTFQSWSADTPAIEVNPYNGDASYYNDGAGSWNQDTAGWYWNNLNQTTTETVSCTATVTPPVGQGATFTVTATKNVTVFRPQWTATGNGGVMQVNQSFFGGNNTDFFLYAGPGPGANYGMNWQATVSAPANTTFGSGSLILVQLDILDISYTAPNFFHVTSTYTWSENGHEGLDTIYPYGWAMGAPNYISSDSPGLDLTYFNAVSAHVGDQFEDYLMYFAPGSTQCVPLARFVWSVNGNATIPGTNNWANYVGNPGTITPSNVFGNGTNFLQSNSFPMWTQINITSGASANGHF